ncbi:MULTISPECIES: mycothiol transferase [Brevibacterium]|nr:MULTISPECIES: DinB family protein [Brevibacterium]
MDAVDLLADLAQRPIDAVAALPALTPEQLNAHPAGHPNSIAWLLWHTGREVDVQLADLTADPPRWEEYRARFDLGEVGETIGYGHSAEQAGSIRVEDQDLLVDYLRATLTALRDHVRTLSASVLDEVVDEGWDPPVTRGVRLVSIVDDAIAHVAQAAYAAGALTSAPEG